jgi:catechol 2,3-dioxygenase-like lactoylglutathione lyase family enzyme
LADNDGPIHDFDWLLSCTTDFDMGVAFVRDVLGMEITAQGDARVDKHFSRYACARLADGRTLEIVEPSEAGRHLRGKQILCFKTHDAVQARLTLEQRGAQVISAMIHDGQGTGWFYVQGPDGNVYQIYGPAVENADQSDPG